MKKMMAGVRVESHARSFGEDPYVTIHKLGTEFSVWMTPKEAKEFAEIVVEAAEEVDKP